MRETPDDPEPWEIEPSAEESPAEPDDSPLQGPRERQGRAVDDSQARVFPCESCGADLEFSIGQQTLKCPYCGFQKQIELREDAQIVEQGYHAAIERLEQQHEQGRHDEAGNQEVHCESCGGTVMFSGTLTSTHCPWCEAPILRENIHSATHRIPVDAVMPFLIEKDRAQAVLKEWINSRWFAPNEFRRRGIDGKFDGFYLPFWTFDALTFNAYLGQRGEHYTVTVGSGKNRRTETRTRWYPASGRFQRFFDDVLICATQGLPTDLINELEPWPMERMVPFTQQVLAGLFARTYDVPLDAGFEQGREWMRQALDQDVRRRIGGDTQQVDSIQTRHDAITFKHLLLPVWMLAYRYHDNTFRVFVNAATGEVQGERPYSWLKITLLVVLIAAAIAAIYAMRSSGGGNSFEGHIEFGIIAPVARVPHVSVVPASNRPLIHPHGRPAGEDHSCRTILTLARSAKVSCKRASFSTILMVAGWFHAGSRASPNPRFGWESRPVARNSIRFSLFAARGVATWSRMRTALRAGRKASGR